MPRGGHALSWLQPHQSQDEPLQNTCFEKQQYRRHLCSHRRMALGFIGSDPKPDNIRFGNILNVITSELVCTADVYSFTKSYQDEVGSSICVAPWSAWASGYSYHGWYFSFLGSWSWEPKEYSGGIVLAYVAVHVHHHPTCGSFCKKWPFTSWLK